MLEAIVNGRYYWIPFGRLSEVRIEKPADLRDIAWTPAYLTLANGGETVGLDSDALSRARRSRRTRRCDWRAAPSGREARAAPMSASASGCCADQRAASTR